MKRLSTLAGCVLLSFSCYSQVSPAELINQLPVVFTAVCVSDQKETEAYLTLITEFSQTVQHQIDLLAPLKTRSRAGSRFKTGADNSELLRELEKVKKSISVVDFATEFENAVDINVIREKQRKMDQIIRKMSSTTDERETEKLMAEVHKVMVDYCKHATGNFIRLLIDQRTLLRMEIDAIIKAEDIRQKMDCNSNGYTYFQELSWERAYILILDHLKYMHQLVSFSPGNE